MILKMLDWVNKQAILLVIALVAGWATWMMAQVNALQQTVATHVVRIEEVSRDYNSISRDFEKFYAEYKENYKYLRDRLDKLYASVNTK